MTERAFAILGRSWRTWELAALLALVVFCVFANGLNTPYMFDDVYWIRDNPAVRVLWPIASDKRPLGYFTLQLNHALHGDRVFGYHAVNIAIHAAACVVLFLLVKETLELPGISGRIRRRSTLLAIGVALLWGVHPLQTSSVTYIIQRFESLMGLGFLLCLYGVLRGATSGSNQWLWYASAWLSFVAGIASKEIIAACPLVVLLFDRAFLSGSFGRALRQRCWLYLAFLPPLVWLFFTMRGTLSADDTGNAGFGYQGVTPWEYLRSQGGVILHYLRLSFWPDALCLDYAWPVARTPLAIYLPGAGVLALLLASLWATWKLPRLGFLGLSFFLILAPTSSFMPIADLAFEHRMYLPLACVVVFAVLALNEVLERFSHKPEAQAKENGAMPPESSSIAGASGLCYALAACAALLSVRTVIRNEDYRSPLTMWAKVAQQAPHNARAHTNLALLLEAMGKPSDARGHLQTAMQITPKYARAFMYRGDMYAKEGNAGLAVTLYRQSLEIHPRYVTARLHLGKILFLRQADYAGALTEARQVLAIEPDSREGAKLVARVLATADDNSLRNGLEAVRLLESTPPPPGLADLEWLDLLAAAHAEAGNFEQAADYGERALTEARRTQSPAQKDIASRLEGYRKGISFRQSRAVSIPRPTVPNS